MKIVKHVLRTLAVVYTIALAGACISINSLMFHPEMVRGGYGEDLPGFVDLGKDGERVAAVVRGPAHGKKAIIYCHGNAEDITSSLMYLDEFARRGYTACAVDYPGYGLSSGKPTEEGCYRNVHLLYRYLRENRAFAPEDIAVIGFSIGSGPATELAATEKVGALVLEAAFLSAPRVVTGVRILPIDPFPNIARIGSVAAPTLVIHGEEDEIVPFSHGQKLYEASGAADKRFVAVPGAGHIDFAPRMGLGRYFALVEEFVNR